MCTSAPDPERGWVCQPLMQHVLETKCRFFYLWTPQQAFHKRYKAWRSCKEHPVHSQEQSEVRPRSPEQACIWGPQAKPLLGLVPLFHHLLSRCLLWVHPILLSDFCPMGWHHFCFPHFPPPSEAEMLGCRSQPHCQVCFPPSPGCCSHWHHWVRLSPSPSLSLSPSLSQCDHQCSHTLRKQQLGVHLSSSPSPNPRQCDHQCSHILGQPGVHPNPNPRQCDHQRSHTLGQPGVCPNPHGRVLSLPGVCHHCSHRRTHWDSSESSPGCFPLTLHKQQYVIVS